TLTKIGPGELVYAGSSINTFDGTTSVAEGQLTLAKTSTDGAIRGTLIDGDGSGSDTVVFAGDNQIANNASVTVNQGAELNLSNHPDPTGPLPFVGGRTATGAAPLPLAGEVTVKGPAVSIFVGGLNLGVVPAGGTLTRTFAVNGSLVINSAITS